MPRRFQVTLDASGIFIPVAGDQPIVGFLAIRRVLADAPEEAERLAAEALMQEYRYRDLMASAARTGGNFENCKLQQESITDVSWFRWYFAKPSAAFIFYQAEEEATSGELAAGR